MGDRAIIHIDINHCFAQIEEMKYPELKHVPMCVGGKEETRNGIVLARNLKAKAYGIKTAESLRDAYRKCPELLVIHPSYDDYQYYSDLIKGVYREYTDDVESFGIDEAWLDVSASQRLFGSASKIGKEIQERVLKEFGITVSVGVSFNKIFSKLGSDMTKPSGFHVITKDNYKEVIWDLPASELLYVGPKTYPKLQKLGIDTIGELAQFDVKILKNKLGKHGELIWAFANGLDESDVDNTTPLPKSIGNGITTPRNIETFLELKQVLYVLIESVASRMKDKNLEGTTISVTLRDTDLVSMSRHLTV
ncbi:MAG TPA: DNA polymerase IV, partial [Erysipelothrix sp.]|nr:DNA polymerase IV [Erysipelothrix sp.]